MFGFSSNLVHFQQLQFGGSTSNLFLKIYASVPIGYFFLTIFFLLCCSARQILGKMFWGFAKILIFSKVILLPLRKCPSRVWFSEIITIKKICSEYILGVFSMKVMYLGGLPWWLGDRRICLAVQKAWVQSLVWDDPTCCKATKPEHRSYWACSPQPGSHNCRSCSLQPGSHTAEPALHSPGATTAEPALYSPGATLQNLLSTAQEPQLQDLLSTAREPQLLKPQCSGVRAPKQEKPLQKEAPAPQPESSCHLP